jgi:hypothetical protein
MSTFVFFFSLVEITVKTSVDSELKANMLSTVYTRCSTSYQCFLSRDYGCVLNVNLSVAAETKPRVARGLLSIIKGEDLLEMLLAMVNLTYNYRWSIYQTYINNMFQNKYYFIT